MLRPYGPQSRHLRHAAQEAQDHAERLATLLTQTIHALATTHPALA